jgi:hypothetical protein
MSLLRSALALAAAAPWLMAPSLSRPAQGQPLTERASDEALRELAELMRARSPDGPFLVDLGRRTCMRVVSAVRRGPILYFRMANNAETSEFDPASGAVTWRPQLTIVRELIPGGADAVRQCVADPVRFELDRVTRAGPDEPGMLWDGPAATYCREMVVYEGCRTECRLHSSAGARNFAFTRYREIAVQLVAREGGRPSCAE